MITNKDILGSRQLAGRVTRWHTWPMIRKPNNAEHSARVATIYIEIFGLPRAEVLEYCLKHDWGELTAGDTPYGAKQLVPELKIGSNDAENIGLQSLGAWPMPTLTTQEWARFKVCDLAEMWETAKVERNMGNLYADAPLRSCYDAMNEMLMDRNRDNDRLSWLAWMRGHNG